MVGREARQGVLHAHGGAAADPEAAVLAAGRGAEGEVRLFQGRGEFSTFFFIFSFFVVLYLGGEEGKKKMRKGKRNKFSAMTTKSNHSMHVILSTPHFLARGLVGDEPEK